MDVINRRRSVRKFTDKPISDEHIELLLRAAMQAPSAGNQQPWAFVVVNDKLQLDALSRMSPYATPLNSAAIAIVVLGNQSEARFPENLEQDLSAATENILLEAVELNLGTTWLGISPIKDRMAYISEVLRLSHEMIPFAAIAVGHPEQEDANKFIDRFDPTRIYYNHFKS